MRGIERNENARRGGRAEGVRKVMKTILLNYSIITRKRRAVGRVD